MGDRVEGDGGVNDWLDRWSWWLLAGSLITLWAAAFAYAIATTDRVLIWRERRRWKAGR